MQQIKICPDCSSEYYAHIERCADCGAFLLTPEDAEKIQEERQRTAEMALKDRVVVREGDLKWMRELYSVLIDSGIPCMISGDDGCNKGCCGDKLRLLVSSQDVEMANQRVEEYYAEIHPEIQASKDMISQGKCPACSCTVGSDAVECPDCGLTLLMSDSEG
jgi:hypothetical protein